MENECSAIPSRLSWVSDTTGSSRLQSMCKSSSNLCPDVSTSSVLLGARPADGTRRTVTGSKSRLCIAWLNMQLQPGQLSCHLPPPANLRKFSWSRPEPSHACRSTPDEAVLANPSRPLFQRVSKPSPSKETDNLDHLPPADNRRQTLLTTY